MNKVKLDKYEEEILSAYEADEFESVVTPERKLELHKIAKNTFKKDKRINIRILNSTGCHNSFSISPILFSSLLLSSERI